MEVLGAVTSSLAVLDGAAVGIRKTIQTLRRLKKAPRELSNLLDQVQAIVSVTDVVSDANLLTTVPDGLRDLLNQLRRNILELEQLIHFKLVKPGEELEVDRIAWTRHWREVSIHLNDISRTTEYISLILTASTFLQTAEVRSQLKDLAVTTTRIRDDHSHAMSMLTNKVDGMTVLCNQIQSSATRVVQVERLLEPLRQVSVQAPVQRVTPAGGRPHLTHQAAHINTMPFREQSQPLVSVTLKDTWRSGRACSRTCRCRCHKLKSFTLPSSLRNWIGTLHITVADPKLTWTSCTVSSCRKQGDGNARIQYTFPPWVASTMISAWYRGTTTCSIERLLRLVRVAESDAYFYAQVGDLVALRTLYVEGGGSIHDMDPTIGKSALGYAISADEFDVIRFLLTSGADLTQQDFSGVDSRGYALERYQFLRQGQVKEQLCTLFDIDDILDEEDFTSMHRIVLGRSSRSLTEELEEHPEALNIADSHGRSPLYWAVRRDDVQATRVLLEHGADIRITSSRGKNIFHLFAASSRGAEMFSLLSTVLSEDSFRREVTSSCLNAADGYAYTPWLIAILYNETSLLQSFLDYELNFNAKGAWGRTLFHTATLFADVEMLRFLATVDFERVDLLAADKQGYTAMDFILTRLKDQSNWTDAPPYSEEAAEALVKLVAHARKFEPRLPSLIYGVRLGEENHEPDYGLFDSTLGTDIHNQWAEWVDVEDWQVEHGRLSMYEAWEGDSDHAGESENEEMFFDATDSPRLFESVAWDEMPGVIANQA